MLFDSWRCASNFQTTYFTDFFIFCIRNLLWFCITWFTQSTTTIFLRWITSVFIYVFNCFTTIAIFKLTIINFIITLFTIIIITITRIFIFEEKILCKNFITMRTFLLWRKIVNIDFLLIDYLEQACSSIISLGFLVMEKNYIKYNLVYIYSCLFWLYFHQQNKAN